MRGNAKCPCGSGLKFKRCCRNKERDAETCYFCGKVESKEVKGSYTTLIEKAEDRDKKEPDIWACEECISEQQPGSDGDFLIPLMMIFGSKWINR